MDDAILTILIAMAVTLAAIILFRVTVEGWLDKISRQKDRISELETIRNNLVRVNFEQHERIQDLNEECIRLISWLDFYEGRGPRPEVKP